MKMNAPCAALGPIVMSLLAACGSSQTQLPPGGALVTFAMCGGTQTLTIATTNSAFVSEARQLVGSGRSRIPNFDLLDGAGADPQWSWHVNPATPAFSDAAIELCDGCPRDIESDKAYWLQNVKTYCPWSAIVSAVSPAP
jgi:hypothetical protein